MKYQEREAKMEQLLQKLTFSLSFSPTRKVFDEMKGAAEESPARKRLNYGTWLRKMKQEMEGQAALLSIATLKLKGDARAVVSCLPGAV
jgi:hypothetical protein